jgi:tripartite-type tricarboxylate transporter receptor subunit TctC
VDRPHVQCFSMAAAALLMSLGAYIESIAKSKPDGYTLGAAFTSVLTINPHAYKTLPYDTFRDFAPISQTVTNTTGVR